MRVFPCMLCLAVFGPLAGWSAEPARNAEKYPQDTPRKALASLCKALEARDIEYWIAHLIAPEDTKRLVERWGSIASAALMNADNKHAERVKKQCELMKKMLDEERTTSGEEKGAKWVRFHSGQTALQLELQPDGRWCMNTRVSTAAQPAGDAK